MPTVADTAVCVIFINLSFGSEFSVLRMRFYNAVSRGKKGPLSLRHFPLIVLLFDFESLSCGTTAIVAAFADPSSFLDDLSLMSCSE